MSKMPNFLPSLKSFLIFFGCLSVSVIYGQRTTTALDQMFYTYEIKNIETAPMYGVARSGDFFQMDVPLEDGKVVTVELHDSKVISDDYISQYADGDGVHVGSRPSVFAATGHIVGDLSSSVSLTIGDGFLYGFVREGAQYTFIEPLSHLDDSAKAGDQYVIYHPEDVKPTAPKLCGATEMHERHPEVHSHDAEPQSQARVGDCYIVEWAIANDFLMYEHFNFNIGAVEAHAIGVANNVQTNYDDEFADEVQFEIVTQFTATTAASDPWTSSTNASTLLNDFTNWGPTGFGVIHDIGSIWTDRDFQGGTIGVAWLNAVCTSIRYNALQNWSNNASLKRVMVAHEIGHNFNANHDAAGSGFIMAPSVNNTTTWSANSITRIENHIITRTCLDNCVGSNAPPVAGFDFTIIDDCTPGSVIFTNTSSGTVTDFFWEFEGGTPATSTAANPSVQYNFSGIFDVTLTVTNAGGSDEIMQNNIIQINDSPEADFSYAINGTSVSFFNLSQFADDYEWDFGDGTTSVMSDPVHDFLDDGVYTVTLTASSACGDNVYQEVVVIANPPTADFTADIEEGCAVFSVQYTAQASNNTDDYLWVFEGGVPGTSNQINPVVEYATPGVYDVSLTVLNETGDDVDLRVDFITVNGVPTADFTYEIVGNEVSFENTGLYGESFIWTFGDGGSSTEENPSHTYTEDGTYTVTFTSESECGSTSSSQTVTISLAPVPSITVSGDTEGCAPFMVEYQSTSTNSPDTYEWAFEGGTPATSTEANPSVTYAEAGTYDVTLTVANGNGSNTETFVDYITVAVGPSAGFTSEADGLEITFTDQSTAADTYGWTFGDGSTSTEANPTHTYGAEGIYTVTQTVVNECGTSSESTMLNTYTPVTAGFTSDITSGCADLSVDFADMSSSNVVSWQWSFPGGTPATSEEQNPTVIYSDAGQYDVILTVSHPESSETVTLTNYIAVSDVPQSSFEYFDDLFVVDFTNTSVEGDSYVWNFGDGNTSTMENPTHTYAAEGTYDVTLTAINACGSTMSTTTVEINALPTAGFTAENTEGCGPLAVQFNNASSSNSESFAWSFPGGTPATSTEENPIVTYETAGTYDVTLEVSSPAGTDVITLSDYVTVNTAPTASILVTTDGNIITATNTGTGGTTIWEVDGQEFEVDELIFTATENGIYSISLTSTNACGEASEVVDIEINVFPIVSYDDLPIIVCVDEAVVLMDNSVNATGRNWTLVGASPATSTDTSPEVSYAAVGTYDIVLEVTNEFGSATATFSGAVTVIDEPSVAFIGDQVNNTVQFTSTVQGASDYVWNFGDGNTSTEENPLHEFTKNGIYEVTLTATNQCGSVTVTETYNINSNSVTDATLGATRMYPNPASDKVTLEVANAESDQIIVQIIDVQGRVVSASTFTSSQHIIHTDQLLTGTYLVRLQSTDGVAMKKLVVVR